MKVRSLPVLIVGKPRTIVWDLFGQFPRGGSVVAGTGWRVIPAAKVAGG